LNLAVQISDFPEKNNVDNQNYDQYKEQTPIGLQFYSPYVVIDKNHYITDLQVAHFMFQLPSWSWPGV
jgi:hypothetical protein